MRHFAAGGSHLIRYNVPVNVVRNKGICTHEPKSLARTGNAFRIALIVAASTAFEVR